MENSESSGENTTEPAENADTDTLMGTNMLVVYFSLADEQYEVGVIEKGNTQIVAKIIAEQTGADTFSIEPTAAYPTTYDGLLEISPEEDNPPEIAGIIKNMEDYDVIFIDYPNYWGDMPLIISMLVQVLYGLVDSLYAAQLGGNTVVCPGVHIGDNVVIGAGSVVTRDIPDWYIAAGNSCKLFARLQMEINENCSVTRRLMKRHGRIFWGGWNFADHLCYVILYYVIVFPSFSLIRFYNIS